MKEFLQRKKSIIGKFAVDQFVFSILGIMVSSAVIALNEAYTIYAGLFSSIFYLALIFSTSYYEGEKDAISVEGGRVNCHILSGLFYALIEYIPTILLTIFNFIFCFLGKETLFAFTNIITRFFTMGMYLGIDSSIRIVSETLTRISDLGVIFLICLIFLPIVSQIGYYCGRKNIHITKKTKNI